MPIPRPSTSSRCFSMPHAAAVLCAMLLFACSAASAATHCVNTSAELANAFDAFIADDEDTVIHIAQGSYVLNEMPYQLGSDVTLIGGYSDGSCDNGRAYDPSLTVLNPGATGNTFSLGAEDATMASVTVRGFTGGAFVQVVGDTFFDGELRLSRVRFEGNRFNVLDSDDTTIIEVVAQGSTGTTSSASDVGEDCALYVDGDDNSTLSILHSTIANNAGNGLCVHGRGGNDGLVAIIENSIVYGNNTSGGPNFVDVFISGTQNYELRNNHIPSFSGFPAPDDPSASSGNSDADPFFVNLAGNDFRLQLGSGAIDSGAPNVFGGLPQLDIVGNPRFVGSAPDRGAYESSFDGSEELIVTDAADTNTPGTLRWALTQANTDQGYSVIRFNIPGACPRAIDLGSPLPQIVSAVGIDGYSQPGSHPNTRQPGFGNDADICVLLRGGGTVANGLHIPTAAGSVGYLQMSGLAFGNFASAAVRIEAGLSSILYGNQIGGTLADGAVMVGQQPYGFFIAGSAEHTQIGGPDPWQMNLISDTTDYAIALNAFSEESIVENNFIGVGPSGNSVLPNNFGIGISANDNLVRGNAIAGSAGAAIFITGHRNNIWLNQLGRRVGFFICPIGSTNCDPDLFNASHGVLIQGSATDNVVQGNVIAKSGGAGIRATSGQRNSFVANRIRDSGEWSIDLGALGPNGIDNDTTPAEASEANRGINAPFLIGAGGGRLQGAATGTLTTTNGNYLLQAFAGRCINNRAQPEQLVGLASVTISDSVPGANGAVAFDIALRSQNPPASLPGRFISVMATEILPNGDATHSSELSACRGYVASDDLFADGFE